MRSHIKTLSFFSSDGIVDNLLVLRWVGSENSGKRADEPSRTAQAVYKFVRGLCSPESAGGPGYPAGRTGLFSRLGRAGGATARMSAPYTLSLRYDHGNAHDC